MAAGDFLGSTSSRTRGVLRIVVVASGLVLAAATLVALFALYGGLLDTLANSDRFWTIVGAVGTLTSVVLGGGALYLQGQQRKPAAPEEGLLPVADPGDSDTQHPGPGVVTAAPDSAPGLVQRAAPSEPLSDRIRLLEQARQADPTYTPAAYALANLLYGAGRYKEALAAIDDALARERTKSGYFVLRARVLRALGRSKDALGAAYDAVQVSGLSAPAYAWQTLGLLYAETGDAKRAEQALRQALAGASANVDIKRELAEVLVRQGKDEEAVTFYKQVSTARPGDVVVHMRLAAALRRLRRYTEALDECIRILSGNPFYAPAEEEQAAILSAQGKRREARAARERAKQMQQARPRTASVSLR